MSYGDGIAEFYRRKDEERRKAHADLMEHTNSHEGCFKTFCEIRVKLQKKLDNAGYCGD